MRITNSTPLMAVHKDLGRRIARCRIDSDFTQKELADRAGVSLGTLARMESGENVSTEALFRVLWALSSLENLEVLLPDADDQPADLLRWNRKAPQRVGRKRG